MNSKKILFSGFLSVALLSCGGHNEDLANKLETAIDAHDAATKAFCVCVQSEEDDCDDLRSAADAAQKAVSNLYVDVDMNGEIGEEMNSTYIQKEGDIKTEFRDCNGTYYKQQNQ